VLVADRMQIKALPYPYQHSVQTGVAAMSVAQKSRTSFWFSDATVLPPNIIDLGCDAHQPIHSVTCGISSQAKVRSKQIEKAKCLGVYTASTLMFTCPRRAQMQLAKHLNAVCPR
jgi:hypothetical protein